MRDTYLLGHSQVEVEHLVAQAEVYTPEAEELLDLVGVPDGGSVADVGCGVLGILPLLRNRVGPRGRVVGIDRDQHLLRIATELADVRRLDVELLEGDATALTLPDNVFDLVHERTVLLNVNQPQQVLAEMVRVARRGGAVVVQEPDASGWVCDPPHEAFDAVRDLVLRAYSASGKDFNRGRAVGRLLRDAGLCDVVIRATARVTAPGEYYHTFVASLATLLSAQIVDLGLCTTAELDDLVSTVRSHLARDGTATCQPIMWQAWGRKP